MGVIGDRGGFMGCVDFVCLAGGTAFDVGHYKVFHVWPPVIGANQGKSVGNSGVSGSVEVMKSV